MKYTALLLITTTAYAQVPTKKQLEIASEKASSYYTGCMGGIIAVMEEDLFKYAQKEEQVKVNFLKLKDNCLKQKEDYRKFILGITK